MRNIMAALLTWPSGRFTGNSLGSLSGCRGVSIEATSTFFDTNKHLVTLSSLSRSSNEHYNINFQSSSILLSP